MSCIPTKCSKCGQSKPACQLLGGVCTTCLGTPESIVPIVSKQSSPCDVTRVQLEYIKLKIQCVIQNGFQSQINLTPTEATEALSKVNNLLKGYSYCQNPIWTIELNAIKNAIITNTSC